MIKVLAVVAEQEEQVETMVDHLDLQQDLAVLVSNSHQHLEIHNQFLDLLMVV
jgi:hypothetical protein